jgi:integrase/recombinase XerD
LSGLAVCFEHDGSLQPRGTIHEQAYFSGRRQRAAPTFHRGHDGARVFGEDPPLLHPHQFAAFLARSPDTATAEDIRRFQVHQSELGMHAPAMNSTVAALRFFFTHTLDRPDLSCKLIRLRYPRKLPSVLSAEEVARLLAAAKCLKHRAALAGANGAGLRVAEVASLKVGDIDSARMLIRVERGKGGRYRHAMLSPDLLTLLRAWWQEGRRQGVMLPGGWLSPGQDPSKPITTRQLGRVVDEAAQTAGLQNP